MIYQNLTTSLVFKKVPNTPNWPAILGLQNEPNTRKECNILKNFIRVTQEVDEDTFEYNADKIDKKDSDVNKNINEQENKN